MTQPLAKNITGSLIDGPSITLQLNWPNRSITRVRYLTQWCGATHFDSKDGYKLMQRLSKLSTALYRTTLTRMSIFCITLGSRGFFSCCLQWKLSSEAAIVRSVTPLNFHRKQQEKKNPLAPRVIPHTLTTQKSNQLTIERYQLS